MTVLIFIAILVAIVVSLMIVYSRQRRGMPDDLEATRRAAAHSAGRRSDTAAGGVPGDFGGGIPG
jgi:hypothetical protein